MASLDDLARAHTDLTASDLVWLHRLVADWQIVADLSFADLVLWLPDRAGTGFWAGAQMRPTTGPTAHVDDLVGSFVPTGRKPLLDAALELQQVVREGDPEWRDEVPVRVEAVPVRHQDRVIGVVGRNTGLVGLRTPSRLELAYLRTAADLTRMVSHGWWPHPGQRSDHTDSPRVGDGFVRLAADGTVDYASPNAVSVYRRLGLSRDLAGLDLAATTRSLVPAARRADEEALSAVLGGRVPRDTELTDGSTVVIVRSIPLRAPAPLAHIGALVLLRDVTDLRSRDRELVTKDATIREIHHRVKNNLQTVAALLRLQARRTQAPEARAALEEAVRRVGSIALVHDTLSQSLDGSVAFDEIADRLRHMVTDLAATGATVTTARHGSFGTLPGQVATSLATVLTELLQNATEHGLAGSGGHLEVVAERSGDRLRITVRDDGRGLPDDFDPERSTSLGLSIVRTLVESELGGTLRLARRTAGGTEAEVVVPVG